MAGEYVFILTPSVTASRRVCCRPTPATPPPRGGRPRGNLLPFNVYSNTRGGLGSPRGRGTGRGNVIDPRAKTFGQGRNLAGKLNAGAPLSKLLYEDRPFLRPIKFVRSVHTATLFQKEDEIFQPVVESAGNLNHLYYASLSNHIHSGWGRS